MRELTMTEVDAVAGGPAFIPLLIKVTVKAAAKAATSKTGKAVFAGGATAGALGAATEMASDD